MERALRPPPWTCARRFPVYMCVTTYECTGTGTSTFDRSNRYRFYRDKRRPKKRIFVPLYRRVRERIHSTCRSRRWARVLRSPWNSGASAGSVARIRLGNHSGPQKLPDGSGDATGRWRSRRRRPPRHYPHRLRPRSSPRRSRRCRWTWAFVASTSPTRRPCWRSACSRCVGALKRLKGPFVWRRETSRAPAGGDRQTIPGQGLVGEHLVARGHLVAGTGHFPLAIFALCPHSISPKTKHRSRKTIPPNDCRTVRRP